MLETLETRPPFKSSRSFLLDLSAVDLRREIVRAVKLDRSWIAEGGPSRKQSVLVPFTELGQVQRYHSILPLPEVDIVFAPHANGIHCWSTSQRKLVWEYVEDEENQDPESPQNSSAVLKLACDVADDVSSILVALLCKRDQQARER